MKWITVALFSALGIVSTAWSQQPNGVTGELKIEQTQFMPDEDMQVKVRVVNRSGQDLTLGQEDDWVVFSIQGEKGSIVGKLADIPAAGAFTLHSSQAGSRSFNLAPYFDFHRAGRYTIGATIKIPQWSQAISCKQVSVNIADGVRVPNVPEVVVGVPPINGDTNEAPEVRKYILQEASTETGSKLYLRLTDATGGRTFRVVPIDRLLSFSHPEAQVDRYSNMHIINQTGAKSFSYYVINPLGQLLERQTYDYTQTRPTLRNGDDGMIIVSGGIRRFTDKDIPPN